MDLRRLLPALTAAVVAALLPTACTPLPATGGADAPPGAADGATGTSPLADPDGTRPGLAALTSAADTAAARALIADVATRGRGPRTGYARDEFGHAWKDAVDGVPLARNGCDTRNDVLRRDGRELRFRSGSDCVVVSMVLYDPYTGRTIRWRKAKAAEVQVDHVVPLSYAWQMGAARWSRAKREQLANDVLNLLPVSGATNSAKRDAGPAAWLPPSRPIRCAYAVRFAQVALKYRLPVTAADKSAMLAQCAA